MPPAVLTVLLLQTAAADSATLRHANGLIPQTVTAVRVQRPPILDGKLDDPAWALAAAPVTDFRQIDPEEGKPGSEATAVLVVCADHAIYVGARLFDCGPRRIAKRLVRRDADSQSDEFRVLFDSYHDHRTAYRFVVNPVGVKSDLFWGDDGGFSDDSWDPVWEAAVAVDSLGWTAELRIPFSQLRFSHAAEQVWGVRFVRRIQRKQEFDMFPFVGKPETGLASRFAHLRGLRDIPAPRRLELLPYSVGRGTYHEPAVAANPFDERSHYFGGAGLDLKYGVTSNLTVDAAFNPDFGQVEIDPAFVNLTAFEQFLPERRPFFVEGRDIFTLGGNGGGVNERRGDLHLAEVRIERSVHRQVRGDAVLQVEPRAAQVVAAPVGRVGRHSGLMIGAAADRVREQLEAPGRRDVAQPPEVGEARGEAGLGLAHEREHVELLLAVDPTHEAHPPHLLGGVREPELREGNPELGRPAERIDGHGRLPYRVPRVVGETAVVAPEEIALHADGAHHEAVRRAMVVVAVEQHPKLVALRIGIAPDEPLGDPPGIRVEEARADVDGVVVVDHEDGGGLRGRLPLLGVDLPEVGDGRRRAPRLGRRACRPGPG